MTPTATATAAPTREELLGQLEDYRGLIADAEAAIGAAALDNTSPSAVARQKKLKDARDGAERMEAALAELDRREEAQADQGALAAASAERKLNYEWCATYLGRVETVLALQAELRAAEGELLALNTARGGGKVRNAKRGYRGVGPVECDLDTDLIAALPSPPAKPKAAGETMEIWRRNVQVGTPERARELRELAELRAQQEAAGEGIDYSGVEPARSRERRERREATRAAAKEAERLAGVKAAAERAEAKRLAEERAETLHAEQRAARRAAQARDAQPRDAA
jgi:fused signal recognition particle receptor